MLAFTLAVLAVSVLAATGAPLPLQSQAIAPYAILVEPGPVIIPTESQTSTTPLSTASDVISSSAAQPSAVSTPSPKPTTSVVPVRVAAEDFDYAEHAVGAGGELQPLRHALGAFPTVTQDAPYAFLLTTLAPSLSHMSADVPHLSTIEELAAEPTPLPTFDFARPRIGTVERPPVVQGGSHVFQ